MLRGVLDRMFAALVLLGLRALFRSVELEERGRIAARRPVLVVAIAGLLPLHRPEDRAARTADEPIDFDAEIGQVPALPCSTTAAGAGTRRPATAATQAPAPASRSE